MLFERKLKCSFCRKSAAQVAKLVAGRRGYICDVCAAEAHRIMSEPDSGAAVPPSPQAISLGARIKRWLSRLSRVSTSTLVLDRPARSPAFGA
jgi:hypothetical protein